MYIYVREDRKEFIVQVYSAVLECNNNVVCPCYYTYIIYLQLSNWVGGGHTAPPTDTHSD